MSPLEELLSNVENGENWPRALGWGGGCTAFLQRGWLLHLPWEPQHSHSHVPTPEPSCLSFTSRYQIPLWLQWVLMESQLGCKDTSLVQAWITNMVAGGRGEGSDLQRSPHANNPSFLPSVPLALPSWPSPSK